MIWTQDATTTEFKPIVVRTGLSDGTRTEIIGGDLQEGTEIIVSDLTQAPATTTQRPQTNNPFGVPNLGGGRGRGGF